MAENIIYCFSGSGNCLNIAKNIAKRLGDTDIVMMRREPSVTNAYGAKRVGFVFPCHAGGMPIGMAEKVAQIKIAPKTYTFGVCSYAGYIGCGLDKLNDLVPLTYWAGVPHLCSCIWLMPPITMPLMDEQAAQKRSENLAAQISIDVNSYMHSKEPPKMAINEVERKAWPTLAKLKALKLKAGSNCIGCGQCAKLCPQGNIKLVNGKPKFGTNCVQCLSCVQFCPKQAISLGGATKTRRRYHNANVSVSDLMEKVIHID